MRPAPVDCKFFASIVEAPLVLMKAKVNLMLALGLLAAATTFARLQSDYHTPTPSAAEPHEPQAADVKMPMEQHPVTLNHVSPGMTLESTLKRLGEPSARGSTRGAESSYGNYAVYGSKRFTWAGRPTIVFSASAAVLLLAGDEVECDGKKLFGLGDTANQVHAALVTPGLAVEVGGHIFITRYGNIHVGLRNDKVVSLSMENYR